MLRSLDVSRNQLERNLPKSLINCKALQLMNVESNKIKDKFPSWLGSLPSLHVLIVRSNEFYGLLYDRDVSVGFQSLRVIDISQNDFTGTLPTHYFSNWREMRTLTEENDRYMQDFVNYSTIYHSMEIELLLLNLSGNAFTSEIPRFLANLTNLETLDLSCNKFTGQIPQDLGKLSFLSYMNFSHNLLQGPVPRGTQFQRQKCSSFLDNSRLYGLEEICGESHVLNPTSQQPEGLSEWEEQMFNWVAAAIAYVPGVFCGLVIGHIFMSHNHEWFNEKFGRRKLRVTTTGR
ncbi:receptor like protein 30 [Eutrema salsugineum]|uniref:receptor like protein 30 n=1 Tax=Eutrema salsugineum TaxID=72664 RepID=UPI000CED49C2|nr:receptor like protein 30 [Eutrema salsugineum]